MLNIVYIVLIEDEDGRGNTTIHSVHSNEADAAIMKSELNSSLDGMIAYFEEHEVD